MKISGKNKLLGTGILTLLVLSYMLAIKKTISLKNESKQLEEQVTRFSDIPNKLMVLNQKNEYYDSILGSMDFNDTSLQNNLIRTITAEAQKNKVKVMDFNEPHIFPIEESVQHTYNFMLEGNFADILKVVHVLERKGNFGEVVHLDFEKKKDYRTNREYLSAKVMVQQLQ